MKLVLRYANRKLYMDGKYINMSTLLDMVNNDVRFIIVSHVTGKDITDIIMRRSVTKSIADATSIIDMLKVTKGEML